jgi:hypothetical protein
LQVTNSSKARDVHRHSFDATVSEYLEPWTKWFPSFESVISVCVGRALSLTGDTHFMVTLLLSIEADAVNIKVGSR